MKMCDFGIQKGPFSAIKIFLAKTINVTFIYLLTPFNGENFLKILTEDPELLGCVIFVHKMFNLLQGRIFPFFHLQLFTL